MREIKFRVWSENLQKMSKPFGLHANVVDFTDENGLGSIKSLSSEVIMQYTGIKDCDGNEIYEGDVLGKPNLLGNKTRKGKVVFRNGCFFVDVDGQDNFYSILLHEYINNDHKRKIIGNVHENKGE